MIVECPHHIQLVYSLLLLLFLCNIYCVSAGSNIRWVDGRISSKDTNQTGTLANPCITIACAIDIAVDDDIIYIKSGVYTGYGNEGLCNTVGTATDSTEPSCGKQNLIISGYSSVSSDVVIQSNGINSTRFLYNSYDSIAKIENMTIQNFRLQDSLDIDSILTLYASTGAGIIVQNSTISVTNVVFHNNTAISGAAITVIASTVNVTDSIFSNNTAYIQGGAMFAEASNLNIIHTSFVYNRATTYDSIANVYGHGGAIYFLGNLDNLINMTDSTFHNNSAYQTGGALYIDSLTYYTPGLIGIRLEFYSNSVLGTGSCTITNSCFARGGAIYMNLAAAYLIDSEFIHNSVSSGSSDNSQVSQGGAIYSMVNRDIDMSINRDYIIEIYNCIFQYNNADGYGGAYYSNNQYLLLKDSHFSYNFAGLKENTFSDSATSGGAVWYSGSKSDGLIDNCVFTSNYVWGGWGGGIFVDDSSPLLNIRNVTFIDNIAYSSYSFNGKGGALSAVGGANLTVLFCNFYNNSAMPITSSIDGATPTMLSGYGGAIYIQSSYIALYNCTVVRNIAVTGQFDSGSNGGAVLLEHALSASISDCTFSLNGASGYLGYSSYSSSGTGGAIMLKFSPVSIDGCVFHNNWVTVGGTQKSEGGAIAIYSSSTDSPNPSINIKNSKFLNNYALGDVCVTSFPKAGSGGAISLFGADNVFIDKVTFYENVAMSVKLLGTPSFGGAISNSLQSTVIISTSDFIKNVAVNGLGDDVSILPLVGSLVGSNFTFDHVAFEIANAVQLKKIGRAAAAFSNSICSILRNLVSDAAGSSSSSSSSSNVKTSSHTRSLAGDKSRIASLEAEIALSEGAVDAPRLLLSDRYNDIKAKHIAEIKAEVRALQSFGTSEHRRMQSYERVEDVTSLLLDYKGSRATAVANGSRRLGIVSDIETLFNPSIFVGAGFATFSNPTFNGNYNIFVGNIVEFFDIENFSGYETASTIATIYGNMEQENLVLIGYKSDVLLARLNHPSIEIAGLHLINSTLYVGNNVTISGNSTYSSSTVSSFAQLILLKQHLIPYITVSPAIPVINVMGNAYSGLGFNNFIGIVDLLDDDVFIHVFNASTLTIDSCIVSIHRSLRMSSEIFSQPTSDIQLYIRLLNNASIIIANNAELVVTSGLLIEADTYDSLAVTNYGKIELSGYSIETSPYDQSNKKFISIGNKDSVYSPLHVYGVLNQTSSGSLHITLSNSINNTAVLSLYNNESMLGTVSIDLAPATYLNASNDGQYYGSQFSYALFNTVGRNAHGSVSLVGPSGLKFGYETVYDGAISMWKEVLEVDNIACSQIVNYYQPSSNICGYCSRNSSCDYCSNGFCTDAGTCKALNSVAASSCCSDCNDAQGTCKMKGSFNYYCECNFFYSGTSCNNLSAGSLSIIIASVFLFTFASISFYYKAYYKGQKSQVIEELRQGLLQSEDGNYMADNKVIQSLQQELILKDVFVNYKEIKLEGKIGEGSFGVVYKATFRGAQVAVKKMRSPLFMEITQSDIEEFRKEAYVMSRLRHPNIVLVMGISLAEQDPPKGLPDAPSMPAPPAANAKKGGSNKSVCIVTEYLEQGSLADILYGPTRLPAEVWSYELVLTCALQAARGMLYLHSHTPPICHRDLKSSNLVVDDHWVVKVTDFGMSRIVPEKLQDLDKGLSQGTKELDKVKVEEALDFYFERDSMMSRHSDNSIRRSLASNNGDNTAANIQVIAPSIVNYPYTSTSSTHINHEGEANSTFNLEMTSNLGTTAWCAPELLTTSGNTTKYSVKVDVYSFGMVLWEIWEKKRPFDELHSRFDIMDAIRSGKRPSISDNCPPALSGLIQRCWASEPARRPMFKYIVKYLKDELARVKRRTNSSIIPPGFLSTSLSLSEWNNYLSPRISSGDKTMLSESPKNSPGGSTNLTDRVSNFFLGNRSRSNTMSSETQRISEVQRTSETTQCNTGNSSSSSNAIDTSAVPTSRKSLVQFERSLSYLASSPAVTGSMSLLSNNSILNPMNNSASASATGGKQPVVNTWRDRYVMKFSGWKASQPDIGLPPNLTAAAAPASGSVPQRSSLMQSSTSVVATATASAYDADRITISHRNENDLRQERDGSSNNMIMEDAIFTLDSDEKPSSSPSEQRSNMLANAVHVSRISSSTNSSAGSNRSSKSEGKPM